MAGTGRPLSGGGLVFSGKAPDFPIMQVLELPNNSHPYFMATQAHAEMTSRPLHPDRFYLGLVRAAAERRYGASDMGSASPGRDPSEAHVVGASPAAATRHRESSP